MFKYLIILIAMLYISCNSDQEYNGVKIYLGSSFYVADRVDVKGIDCIIVSNKFSNGSTAGSPSISCNWK